MDSTGRIVACMRDAVTESGLEPPEPAAIRDVIGLSLEDAVRSLLPEQGNALHSAVAARYRAGYVSATRDRAPLFPGVRDTLQALRTQGYLLAVATGKGRRGLERALEQSAMAGIFHASRTADEAFSKPHPQMLLDLLDELDVRPGDALMIGDSVLDLEMARNAGTASLAVCCGVHDAARLLEFGPQACLQDVRSLPGWLRPPVSADDGRG